MPDSELAMISILLIDADVARGAWLAEMLHTQRFTRQRCRVVRFTDWPSATLEAAVVTIMALAPRPAVVLVDAELPHASGIVHALEQRGMRTIAISHDSILADPNRQWKTMMANGGAQGYLVIPGLSEILIVTQIYSMALCQPNERAITHDHFDTGANHPHRG